MSPRNWYLVFLVCALVGVITGYVFTLVESPSLLPPVLRFGSLVEPVNVLFMGTDVVYSGKGKRKKGDDSLFTGRSDTMMLVRFDPFANTLTCLSIPRDSNVLIPGHGHSKINAANAIGGPTLASATVNRLLHVPIDHYIVLNLQGLVKCIDEIGGLEIDIPKRMKYKDDSQHLYIDLQPGRHKLSGYETMGFVRFRHDELGDIGRVQRQEMFVQSVIQASVNPATWAHLPKLLEIAKDYISTDMSMEKITQIANFARCVPKKNQKLIMLPGSFAGTGDWAVDRLELRKITARLMGSQFLSGDKRSMKVTVSNVSGDKELGRKLFKYLKKKGYGYVKVLNKKSLSARAAAGSDGIVSDAEPDSSIISQRGNPEEAEVVREDLGDTGEIINASIGDIDSDVTVVAGNDIGEYIDAELNSDSVKPDKANKKSD